jgi:hypothetical protein
MYAEIYREAFSWYLKAAIVEYAKKKYITACIEDVSSVYRSKALHVVCH